MLKEYKGMLIAVIAGVSAIICFFIAANGLISFKNEPKSAGISATGSTNQNFTSDLIVWRGSFSVYGHSTETAYDQIKKNSDIIKAYLIDNGVSEDEMIFYSVNITQEYRSIYNDAGNVVNTVESGYTLSQQVSVTSSDVEKIEGISRDITELIASGVDFMSEAPEYYYTKLDELKLEMIDAATKNAKSRIDIMVENSGAKLGKLLTANLGVFQITAQNSDSEEYSYGGNFNTSSKEKTASVTVKLNYAVE